jgi:hypothetical protein
MSDFYECPSERVDLYRLEHRAQELMREEVFYQEFQVHFDLCGPTGKRPALFLDVYIGLIMISETDGFMMMSDIRDNPLLWAENVRIERKGAPDAQ